MHVRGRGLGRPFALTVSFYLPPSHTDALTPPDDTEEGLSAEELVQRYMERVSSLGHLETFQQIFHCYKVSSKM